MKIICDCGQILSTAGSYTDWDYFTCDVCGREYKVATYESVPEEI